MSEDVMASLDPKKVKGNPAALRDVNKETEEYEGLLASVRQVGIMNAVSVRVNTDGDAEEFSHTLIDGLHRHTAAIDAGLSTIPCLVKSLNDCEVLQAQLIANAHKIETKPVQYSKQLERILAYKPTMTQAELASELGKTGKWLSDRLGLMKLAEKIGALVDSGELNLSNAYILAKLPEDEQANFIEAALVDSMGEFAPKIKERLTEIKKAKREGKDTGPAEFAPSAFLQKVGALKEELDSSEVGKALLAKHSVTAPQEAWNLAIKWSLHMDPDSVSAQKEKDDERKARNKEKSEGRAAEKADKKASKAQDTANKLRKEADAEKAKEEARKAEAAS